MPAIDTARRSFLRGHPHDPGISRRMPWAAADFTDLCQRCGDCVRACEERVLVAGDGGFPTVDFERGGCTFCGACVQACRYGALDAALPVPWRSRAIVGGRCLSAEGITCRACGDACDLGAIRFRLQTGGRAMPLVDAARCSGCGGCVAICPTHAIRIEEAA
jgi:ferredoxin-type protein NapF